MSLLRNSVIVGGATFLVGSAFMEIGKADSKSDIGKWPYIATFLSGALGFYLLKQNFIPVPKALELNAEMDGEKLMVSSRDFDDGSMMVGIGTEDIDVDDPDFMEMMIGKDGKIEQFSLPIGKDDYQRHYQVKPSHYGKMKTQNQTNERAGGDFVRTDGDGKYAHPMIPQGQFMAESLREEYERHWGEIDDDQAKGLIRCRGCDEPTSYYDERNFCEACQGRKKEGLMDDEGNFTDDPSHPLYEYPKPKYAESLQSFAAEVFEADRKIRRRTRWTWTRGQESGFEVENDDISELPYDIDYTGRKGRGYYGEYVPIYSVKDSYHISDLPEGYHLHLYKPALRSSSWKAFSKSPTSDWKVFNNYKKSNLTGELLNWYNQDIAKPEQKTLSPIEKLMISKGMKSGTVQIERIVIPKTKYTTEKIQYFAFGGSKLTKRTTPLNFCVIDSGVVSLENVEYEFEPHLFAFAQGLKFMTEKAGTLRSVNRFNKDPEAWVKSYPAWFQNAVKNKLTDIDVEFIGLGVEKYDSGMKINDILVLKFLNGVDRYSWRPINEDKRKVIDTPYGEMPQFEIYELDMNDPAPIIPRPSTMRKIYAKSFKQNLIGDWKFDKEMFMMAVVDKYKFENGGSESIHNSMTNEPIWVIETIPYMTPMAELMARRYKKKLN